MNESAARPAELSGHPDATRFEAMYRDHYNGVYGYIDAHFPGLETADAVAQTFTIAWRKRSSIPAGAQAKWWLLRVARNVANNEVRSNRRRLRFTAALQVATRNATTTLAGDNLDIEDREILEVAFAQLKPDEQEILLLAAWEDCTGAALATVLGISVANASVRLHRARTRLRALIESGTTA